MAQKSFLRSDCGAGKAGCLLGVLVIFALGYLGFKFLPPIINNYQFQDAVDELASFSLVRSGTSTTENPTETLRTEILKKAQEMGLPIDKEDVIVRLGNDRVEVTIMYVQPIKMPGYTYNYNFTVKSRR